MAEKMLVLDPDKCIGCHTCEMVCSLKHHDGCSQIRSRVRVITDRTQDLSLPIMCQHCENPLCQKVCPTGAISRDSATHAILINRNKCLGCKMCIFVCPFGAPSFDPIDRVTFKCDICEGDPECAKLCPSEAIQFVRNDKIGAAKRRDGVLKFMDIISNMVVGS
ncbi:4Fe-4S dicluster domain-containing protein [Thermodesulfobacteriota bacterium]